MIYINKISEEISNGWRYVVDDNNLIYVNSREQIVVVSESDERILEFKLPINRLILSDLNLYVFDEENNVSVYELTTQKRQEAFLTKNEKLLFGQDLNSEKLVFREEISLLEVKFGIIDREKKSKQIIDDFYPSVKIGDFFFGRNTKRLSCYSESYRLMWELHLPSFGEFRDWKNDQRNYQVESLLGIWKNELLVACSDGLLLSLNVETGGILYKWHELRGYALAFNDLKNKMPPGENFALDVENGKIFGVHLESYFEINLATRKVLVENLKPELLKHDISFFKPSRNNPFTNTGLYLTANMIIHDHRNNWQDEAIVILNRATREIEWKYVFEKNSLGTNNPRIGGNKLYQLDIGGTLYVFGEE